MKLTAQLKLLPTAEQSKFLLDTLQAVNAAATFAAEQGFAAKVFSQAGIHRLAYYAIRTRFGLSAQHAVRAIGKAVEAFVRDKTICPIFRSKGAIALDVRLYRLIGSQAASINTVSGRIRCPLMVSDHFSGMLSGKRGQAHLVHSDGEFFLYVTVDLPEEPPITPKGWIGVDIGIVNLAVDSTGESHSGAGIDRNRRRRATARKQDQRKGTKNARRRLKRMSGRQHRFQCHTNHVVSKRLMEKAKAQQSGIVLEELKHIRSRLQDTVSRSHRRRLGNWSFSHLQKCIEYKARRAGVPVMFVSPKNTSRKCSQCGHCHKHNRKSRAAFCCLHCGYSCNADLNAAKNLSSLGALVNRPEKQQVEAAPLSST